MMEGITLIGIGILSVAILLALWRLARGPTVPDRILSFDAIAICVVGMIVLLSSRWDTGFFLELILVVSLLGFISGVAFVFYLDKTMDVHESTGVPPGPETKTDEETS